jgi:hypothetical protein
MSQIKEKKFSALMRILKLSKITYIKLLKKKDKPKQKHIHINLTSNRAVPYDIYIYSYKSNTLSDILYIETKREQNIIFLQKMEELCNNCGTFEILEKYMKDDSKLFIYSTHHTITDFTSLISRSQSQSRSISPTPTCWGCLKTSRSISRGGKRKNASKTKKIYR